MLLKPPPHLPPLASTLLALLLGWSAVAAQDHDHHGHHGPGTGSGLLEWRMPPMDMSMSMPGLDGRVPKGTPFLPGAEVDLDSLAEAVPSEVVVMADGDTLHLTVTLVRRDLGGQSVPAFAYNGQYPGPLIQVEQNSKIFVHLENQIELSTTVHWHGIRVRNPFDGVPGMTQVAVRQGETFMYEVDFLDAGIYWYHPHMNADIQPDMGLYGGLLVAPTAEAYYSPVNHEEVLILDDILIDARGRLPYGHPEDGANHALMGRFGDLLLVNGEPEYRLEVEQGDVARFYFINAASARTFNITFSGSPMKIVASDVGKFEREEWIDNIVIGSAERYTVEVLFDAPGELAITNSITAIDHFLGEFFEQVDTIGVVTVNPRVEEASFSEAFWNLRENADVAEDLEALRPNFGRPVDHELTLTLKVDDLPPALITMLTVDTVYKPPIEWNDAMPMENWLSTTADVSWILREAGTGREGMDIEWEFQEGDVLKFRIFNDPRSPHPMNHPMHVHGQRFLVLELDGVPNQNLVWKDTAIVPVGSTMDILVEMSNPGDWMFHCHIAEHLEAGMHTGFTVKPRPLPQ